MFSLQKVSHNAIAYGVESTLFHRKEICGADRTLIGVCHPIFIQSRGSFDFDSNPTR